MAKGPAVATIVDVAERAGVSIGTVSRIINNVGNARPDTLHRVQAAMEALSYVPNHVARSLKRQTTEQIELVIPDIANPVYVAMAQAVQRATQAEGYRLSLISTESNPLEELRAVRALKQQHVDGLIICSLRVTDSFLREVASVGRRICVIGQVPASCPVDNVGVDSARGAVLAVQHLAEQGHQRIAFINGPSGTVPAEARQRGYLSGLSECRLGRDDALVITTDFTMTGGRAAIDTLLDKQTPFDAVFCANDSIALGAMLRLQERGVRVPQDVAIVGMDDIDLCKVTTPTLSSISLLAGERGRVAAQLLLERLETPDLAPRRVTVTPRLIVRGSSSSYLIREDVPGGNHAPR
jgi:DNA-binding LacI/PurR family transcriptional regulator